MRIKKKKNKNKKIEKIIMMMDLLMQLEMILKL